MLLTSVVLHGAAVLLVNGASSSSSGPPIDGLRLPPMAVALVVHPPEQRASRQTDAAVVPVAPDLPDLSISQAAPPDAPRLLTPVPRPVENKGGDQPAAAAVMGLMATHYFPTRALTTRPAPTTEPNMQLPDGWLEAFGQARLTLFLSDAGNVDAITLIPVNLAPELHDAVRAAFQTLHFSPGEIDGRPVASVMTIEVDVSLALGKNR
jgi:hypothetical protein